ncbi:MULTISPECIES: phosphatase PAP2 family protein [Streptomyces]|uniref:Phosphatase PAP2 family protein n=1 Tax=Streptomyces griseocarneus TaxID=51201 RepID=A0ABX7RM96_9ACTN|nr:MULTISPECIES: phosphatase PAP2 family protein [Streptomyces]QSY48509.1 phosphatase PAP2 family protein [Streptomyces griseocarneus]
MTGRRTAAGLATLACFALLAAIVTARSGAPLPGDRALLYWAVGHRPATAVSAIRTLTDTGTGAVPYVLAALAGVIAGRTKRQKVYVAAASLLCLGVGQLLRRAVLYLIGRPRPPAEEWATHASGWSFPSGHATTAALTAALVITAVLLRSPPGRFLAVALVGCWGVAVGLTRVYLGVHWFSDVIGAWLFALAWYAACAVAAARWLPALTAPAHKDDPDPGNDAAPRPNS